MQTIEKQNVKGAVQEMGTHLEELLFDNMRTVEGISSKLEQLVNDMREVPGEVGALVNAYGHFIQEFELLSKLMAYTMGSNRELKLDILSLQQALEDLTDANQKEKA